MGNCLSCLSNCFFQTRPTIRKQQNITHKENLTSNDISCIKNNNIPPSCDTIMSTTDLQDLKLANLIDNIKKTQQLTPSEKTNCLEMIYAKYKELNNPIKCIILRHLCFNNKSIATNIKNEFDSFKQKTSHTFKEFLTILYKTDPREDFHLSQDKINMLKEDLSKTIKEIVGQFNSNNASIIQFKSFVTKKTFIEMTYSSDYTYWDGIITKIGLQPHQLDI